MRRVSELGSMNLGTVEPFSPFASWKRGKKKKRLLWDYQRQNVQELLFP